jgi:hypothetical protein
MINKTRCAIAMAWALSPAVGHGAIAYTSQDSSVEYGVQFVQQVPPFEQNDTNSAVGVGPYNGSLSSPYTSANPYGDVAASQSTTFGATEISSMNSSSATLTFATTESELGAVAAGSTVSVEFDLSVAHDFLFAGTYDASSPGALDTGGTWSVDLRKSASEIFIGDGFSGDATGFAINHSGTLSPGHYFLTVSVASGLFVNDFGNPYNPYVGETASATADLDFSLALTEVAAVPVPAAVWFFGSGLLGLSGVAKRRAAT